MPKGELNLQRNIIISYKCTALTYIWIYFLAALSHIKKHNI